MLTYLRYALATLCFAASVGPEKITVYRKGDMVGFEVIVNGERLCTAGSECVCGVTLTFTYREPQWIRFNIGGITDVESMQHCAWKTPSVTIGDEITIRLVEVTAPDAPDIVYDSNSRQGREDGC